MEGGAGIGVMVWIRDGLPPNGVLQAYSRFGNAWVPWVFHRRSWRCRQSKGANS